MIGCAKSLKPLVVVVWVSFRNLSRSRTRIDGLSLLTIICLICQPAWRNLLDSLSYPGLILGLARYLTLWPGPKTIPLGLNQNDLKIGQSEPEWSRWWSAWPLVIWSWEFLYLKYIITCQKMNCNTFINIVDEINPFRPDPGLNIQKIEKYFLSFWLIIYRKIDCIDFEKIKWILRAKIYLMIFFMAIGEFVWKL